MDRSTCAAGADPLPGLAVRPHSPLAACAGGLRRTKIDRARLRPDSRSPPQSQAEAPTRTISGPLANPHGSLAVPVTSAAGCSRRKWGRSGSTSAPTATSPRAPGPLAWPGPRSSSAPSATRAGLSEYLWELEQPAHAMANGYVVGSINRVGHEQRTVRILRGAQGSEPDKDPTSYPSFESTIAKRFPFST